MNEKKHTGPDASQSGLIDVKVNWKRKKVFHPDTKEPEPEGYFLYAVEDAVRTDFEEAAGYMRKLLEYTGIGMDNIAGWEDYLRITHETQLAMPDGTKIPQGTLYLGVKVNRRAAGKAALRTMGPLYLHTLNTVKAALEADADAQRYAEVLLKKLKVFRVWFDVHDRRFEPAKSGGYDWPMTKLLKKPKIIQKVQYRIQLTNMDLVLK